MIGDVLFLLFIASLSLLLLGDLDAVATALRDPKKGLAIVKWNLWSGR